MNNSFFSLAAAAALSLGLAIAAPASAEGSQTSNCTGCTTNTTTTTGYQFDLSGLAGSHGGFESQFYNDGNEGDYGEAGGEKYGWSNSIVTFWGDGNACNEPTCGNGSWTADLNAGEQVQSWARAGTTTPGTVAAGSNFNYSSAQLQFSQSKAPVTSSLGD